MVAEINLCDSDYLGINNFFHENSRLAKVYDFVSNATN